jgi:hypothetical protein
MQSYTIRPAIALRILFDIIIISILKPLLLCVREESKEDNKRRFDFTRFVMPPKWWYKSTLIEQLLSAISENPRLLKMEYSFFDHGLKFLAA